MFWNFLSVIESSFSGFWGPKIFQLASFAMPRFFVAIAMHPTTIPTVLGAVEEFGPEEFDVSKNGRCWPLARQVAPIFLAGFVEVGRHHQKPMWISIRFKKLLKVIFWKTRKDQNVITLSSHNHGSVENAGTIFLNLTILLANVLKIPHPTVDDRNLLQVASLSPLFTSPRPRKTSQSSWSNLTGFLNSYVTQLPSRPSESSPKLHRNSQNFWAGKQITTHDGLPKVFKGLPIVNPDGFTRPGSVQRRRSRLLACTAER